MSEKLVQLEIAVAKHEERLINLEGWQAKQNGSLQRIEGKIDNLISLFMKAAIGLLGSVFVGILLFLLKVAVAQAGK